MGVDTISFEDPRYTCSSGAKPAATLGEQLSLVVAGLATVLCACQSRHLALPISVAGVENYCKNGLPPSNGEIVAMLAVIPLGSLDLVTATHVAEQLHRWGGVRVRFNRSELDVPGAGGYPAKTKRLPVSRAVFIQTTHEEPIVYLQLSRRGDSGRYRASFTSGAVPSLCKSKER